MVKTFTDGKRRGEDTHWFDLNENYTHRLGEVTLWTGYMNEGKSTFLKQLLLAKACFEIGLSVYLALRIFLLMNFMMI